MRRPLMASLLLLAASSAIAAQFAIKNCSRPNGCGHSDTTFNNGRNTGCKVDFHFIQCDGQTHDSVYDSCTNINGRTTCSCSCSDIGYGKSWVTANDVVQFETYGCNFCGHPPTPSPTPNASPTPDTCGGDPCCEDPACCGDPCCGDPCCGDPCCGDPCCGDPCCGDPTCGQQCYQVCVSGNCQLECTIYDDYGNCYYEEYVCDPPICQTQCY